MVSKTLTRGFEGIRLVPVGFNSYGEPILLAAEARAKAYVLTIELSKTLGTDLVVTDDGLTPSILVTREGNTG